MKWFRRQHIEPALFCPYSGHELRRVETLFGDFFICCPCGTPFERGEALRAGQVPS